MIANRQRHPTGLEAPVRVALALLTAVLTPLLLLTAVATPATAAPEPCVTIHDPNHPGYTPPTCPVSVVRGLLP
jgi:hypothetical protein